MWMTSHYYRVAIDTLVIRTMLVPAIMVILGEANWYPKKMPKEKALLE
jgi:uncharacterized membrane protein YdfJ with MMPL/SSD domain